MDQPLGIHGEIVDGFEADHLGDISPVYVYGDDCGKYVGFGRTFWIPRQLAKKLGTYVSI